MGMPLQAGTSRDVISGNIHEMLRAGHPVAQSIAAALRNAHDSARQRRDDGGSITGGIPMSVPFIDRREAAGADARSPMLVNSAVPGRTDRHNADVAAGSYVLPADVVAGLGEDNTMAGAHLTQMLLSSGPYGTPIPREKGAARPPAPPRPASPDGLPVMAAGGTPPKIGHNGGPPLDGGGEAPKVPIVVAGGESIIPPENVIQIGVHARARFPKAYPRAMSDLKIGHEVLDAWVLHERNRHIKTLQKLPKPAK